MYLQEGPLRHILPLGLRVEVSIKTLSAGLDAVPVLGVLALCGVIRAREIR